MSPLSRCIVTAMLMCATGAHALSLAPEEFAASRQLACVLAHQSLGHLSEEEYGAMTHNVLDGFGDSERDNILSSALGYYDGLMFEVDDQDTGAVNVRLENFVASSTCSGGYRNVTVTL